ncbi:MAG: hypothetical protein AVDCRST_MAG93-9344, partial [uncultured Chloroflexia bacterium]
CRHTRRCSRSCSMRHALRRATSAIRASSRCRRHSRHCRCHSEPSSQDCGSAPQYWLVCTAPPWRTPATAIGAAKPPVGARATEP